MDALNKALDALEHNLNQGEYMVECAGTISNKIVGAYLELNDEYQREYFGHEHAKRAQVICRAAYQGGAGTPGSRARLPDGSIRFPSERRERGEGGRRMNNADEKVRAVIEALRVDLAGMTPEQLSALQEDVTDWLQVISENVRALCEELLQEAIDAKRQ